MKKLTPHQIWFIFSLVTLTIIGIFSYKLPIRGDERHIVETIRLFTNNFSFSTIQDYPEVTPPFFYIFYAIWAKVFGSSIESLRILTLIISFITWQFIFYHNILYVKKRIHAFFLSLLIVINPYFFGTSVFVFTDMLTILFCLAAVISFLKDRVALYIIFSALAILCRQYVIILPVAVILFFLISFIRKKPINRFYLFGSLLTLLPLIFLFLIWRNILPESGIEKWVIPNSSFYNLDYINTYVTFSIVYIFPLALMFFNKIRISYSNLTIALVLTIFLSFFPVKSSMATLAFTDYKTVGFVHQAISGFFGYHSIGLKIILWIFLFIGCYINVEILKRLYIEIKEKRLDRKIIMVLLWILFLLIMPFSYQVWEKYLTMILPFLVLSIYMILFPLKDKSTA
jgi:4-amino-4-deoxy-L-arabinose transferase-like glycosyltransferase